MSTLERIKLRAIRDFNKWRYGKAVQNILLTTPLARGTYPFVLLSMVHHRDVLSYIAAVKSFANYINPERVIVICDPTINDSDRQIIKSQLPHVEFRDANEFVNKHIPRGGCWERLYAISEYCTQSYVIQLDADTLALKNITEIGDAVKSGVGFVLGEERNQQLLTFEQASARARPLVNPSAHIQTRSEAILPKLGISDTALYVRGCAGFTGFPSSNHMRERLVEFSSGMTALLGNDWSIWGTEQVTSNYLVANSKDTSVLPFPKYGTPDQVSDDIAFLHFIGSLRFTTSKYKYYTSKIISQIK